MRSRQRFKKGAPESVFLARCDRFPMLSAAYVLSEMSFVSLRRKHKGVLVSLLAKTPGRGGRLAQAFLREYKSQLFRWSVIRSGQALRAEVSRRALEPAGAPGAGENPGVKLTERQLSEIESLLAETPARAQNDPLGIMTPWDQRR